MAYSISISSALSLINVSQSGYWYRDTRMMIHLPDSGVVILQMVSSTMVALVFPTMLKKQANLNLE
jgi:hypothetical protein